VPAAEKASVIIMLQMTRKPKACEVEPAAAAKVQIV